MELHGIDFLKSATPFIWTTEEKEWHDKERVHLHQLNFVALWKNGDISRFKLYMNEMTESNSYYLVLALKKSGVNPDKIYESISFDKKLDSIWKALGRLIEFKPD